MRAHWWRWLAGPVAVLLLVGGCSGGASRKAPEVPGAAAPTLPTLPAVPAVPSPGPGGPVLAAAPSNNPTSVMLGRFDPRSLAPLPGPALRLDGDWTVAAVAPDRSIAVLAEQGAGELTLVGLARMRRLGTVDVAAGGWAAGSSWVGRSRVLLAWGGLDGGGSNAVLLLDTTGGRLRLLRQQRIDGTMLAAARMAGRLVLLLAPVGSIGPARLVVADGDGQLRTVTLPGIAAGIKQLNPGNSPPAARQAVPGLAVDPAGGRAYVVAAGAPVAEVDLGSLRVGYHRLGQPTSLLRRLAGWLVPPAEAKEVDGPSRSAVWLGAGLLGVTGSNASYGPGKPYAERPAGLEVIDTRTWTVAMIAPHASSAVWAAGRLVTFGVSFGARNQGYGLTIFGPGRQRPVHLLGAHQVAWVQVGGDLAYAELNDDSGPSAFAVVDLRANRVLREVPGDAPQLLTPDQP